MSELIFVILGGVLLLGGLGWFCVRALLYERGRREPRRNGESVDSCVDSISGY